MQRRHIGRQKNQPFDSRLGEPVMAGELNPTPRPVQATQAAPCRDGRRSLGDKLTQALADIVRIQRVHDFEDAPPEQVLGWAPQHLSKSGVSELKNAVSAENGDKLACGVNQFGKLC
jgi:hypothetical protein